MKNRLKAPLKMGGRFFRFFRRLQWKLTLTYMLFTVVTTLILAVIGLVILWYINFRSNLMPTAIADSLKYAAAELSPYFAQQPPNHQELDRWLQAVTPSNHLVINIPNKTTTDETDTIPAQLGRVMLVALVDSQGKIIAARPESITAADAALQLMRPPRRDIITPQMEGPVPVTPLQPRLSAVGQQVFTAALQGETDSAVVSTRDPEGHLVAAAPVLGKNGQVVGAMFVELAFPFEEGEFIQGVVQELILPIVIGMAIAGGLAGVLFGFLISRGLTRRLQPLAKAAEAWSRGDFTPLARDTSGDELGQLTRQLNHMAIQLQNLLQTHEELATLEERNRLARELHDSVKQQVFATAMQVGAARALLDHNPNAAKENLLEAEKLVHQAQQELTTLIRELRPAALEGKGLARALRDCVSDWSRQSHIRAEVRVRGERPLPLPLEQALYRVAQEGLTNVARHSRASLVEVELVWDGPEVTLTIDDNGQGFAVGSTDGKGLGLRSMRERVEALGGWLEVASNPGEGTQIKAGVKYGR